MALSVLTLEIPAGQALSNALQISSGLQIVRICMPAAWDAAPITFQISPDNNAWYDLHHVAQTHEGPWVSYESSILQAFPNSILTMPPDAGFNIGWIKFRSGTAAHPVIQQGPRSFALMFA